MLNLPKNAHLKVVPVIMSIQKWRLLGLTGISVHGVRNGTTCDLLAAGVGEVRIKLHCRWMSFDMIAFYTRIMQERRPRKPKFIVCDGTSAMGQKGLVVHGGGCFDYSGSTLMPVEWAQCDNCDMWENVEQEYLQKFFYCLECKKIDGGNNGGESDGADVAQQLASCFTGLARMISKKKF
jgi:hypothetical protein